jgi:hypothetical protein
MDDFSVHMDMAGLTRLFQEAPREMPRATADYLNDVAFAYRIEAAKVIASEKTIRDPRFVQSRFWVEKATPGDPNTMKAISGSIKSDRFTGWAEDYGEHTDGRADRLIGTNARGGSMANKALQSDRLMKGIDIPKIEDFDIQGDPKQQVAAMVSLIARHPSIVASSHGLFMLHSGGWRAGVYRIVPGAMRKIQQSGRRAKGNALSLYTYAPLIQRVQTFEKDMKTKKVDWAHKAEGQILQAQLEAWEKYIKTLIIKQMI